MFSENGKISEKQLRRTLMLPVFASCIFVLPYASAGYYGENLTVGMVVFLGMGVLYIVALAGLSRLTRKDPERRFVRGITIARLMVRLSFYMLLSLSVLSRAQVPFMKEENDGNLQNLLVLLPLLLVAFYGACHDMEKVSRIHEMTFWLTFVPFAVMLLFGLREVDGAIWMPGGSCDIRMLAGSSYLLLTLLLPAENLLWLKNIGSGKPHTGRRSCLSLLGILLLALVLSVWIVGIYGVHGAANDAAVTTSIMRCIRLPLGVLERFDMLMIWFFMTGCFILLCNTMAAIRQNCNALFSPKNAGWMAAIFCACCMLPLLSETDIVTWIPGFLWYGALIDLPLSLLMPLLGHFLPDAATRQNRKRKKKKARGLNATEKLCMWIFAGCFCCVVLTGCGEDMRNVEQRDYATLLLIQRNTDDGGYDIGVGIAKERRVGEKSQVEEMFRLTVSDLDALRTEYRSRKGKDLSLSHLKALLLDGESLSDDRQVAELMYLLDAEDEVAKTCPVLWVENMREMISYVERAKEPVGTYMSDLISVYDRTHTKVPWILDMLKYIREGTPVYPCGLKKEEADWTIYPLDVLPVSW